jgi:sugar transferase (PEP-CTERM/EpsH1 system associated)
VHTRNLSGLDALLPSLCAGIRVRIHGEHGRDADDLQGTNPRYRRVRRLFRPLVTHYTAVSKDLERYLVERIGVPRERISQIYNGVDVTRFHSARPAHAAQAASGSSSRRGLRIGAVGRLQPVKDQLTLVHAYAEALRIDSGALGESSLVIAGEGPLRAEIESEIRRLGIGHRVELMGQRDDVADVLRSLDLFVLPSRDEGISNTLLEAMATGLPVIATRVGGNPELVSEGRQGRLVTAGDAQALAHGLLFYARDADMRRSHGRAARKRAQDEFSLKTMVNAYVALYDRLLGRTLNEPVNVKKSMILP